MDTRITSLVFGLSVSACATSVVPADGFMGVVDAASVDAASAPMADARLADAPEACGELPLPHLLEVMSLMRDPEPQGSVETIEITVRLVDSFVVAAGVVSVLIPDTAGVYRVVAGGGVLTLRGTGPVGEATMDWFDCERRNGRQHPLRYRFHVAAGMPYAFVVSQSAEDAFSPTRGRDVEFGSYYRETERAICRSSGDDFSVRTCTDEVCSEPVHPVRQIVDTDRGPTCLPGRF